jgi:hypothetical protein
MLHEALATCGIRDSDLNTSRTRTPSYATPRSTRKIVRARAGPMQQQRVAQGVPVFGAVDREMRMNASSRVQGCNRCQESIGEQGQGGTACLAEL